MRNYNLPWNGSTIYSNQQRITQWKNLTKSVVITELTKFLRRRSICMLGNTRSNCSRHTSTTCISVVLNNFIKKRLTTKSREANWDLFRGSASSPYNKVGTHLVLTRWMTTSSEAMHPTFSKYYWTHLWFITNVMFRLALSHYTIHENSYIKYAFISPGTSVWFYICT